MSVVGEFNQWDGRRHPMRLRRECGVWELFVPHLVAGDAYQFELLAADGTVLRKADPYAFAARLRPDTACVVRPLPEPLPMRPERAAANARHAPISIYEVHLGSWRRKPEQGNRWLDWDELAATLVPCDRAALPAARSHAAALRASLQMTARRTLTHRVCPCCAELRDARSFEGDGVCELCHIDLDGIAAAQHEAALASIEAELDTWPVVPPAMPWQGDADGASMLCAEVA